MTRPFRKCGCIAVTTVWRATMTPTGTRRMPYEGVGDWVVTPDTVESFSYNVTHIPTGFCFSPEGMTLSQARIVAAHAEIRLPRIATLPEAKAAAPIGLDIGREVGIWA